MESCISTCMDVNVVNGFCMKLSNSRDPLAKTRESKLRFRQIEQRSHNLRKFPQIFAVSMGVVLGIMRILCIPFKILLFG